MKDSDSLTHLSDREVLELQYRTMERTRKNTHFIADIVGIYFVISLLGAVVYFIVQ
jgi:hypothetical protein